MEDYGLERKFHRSETGLVVTDAYEVSGYASLFGLRDQGGDMVARGAYAASLKRLAARGGRAAAGRGRSGRGEGRFLPR